jgi:NAD(P)-dependent dehydrogenase (short-subunit alcohol dehydrogenase family)
MNSTTKERLLGKRVVVIGGSLGVGRTIVEKAVGEGAQRVRGERTLDSRTQSCARCSADFDNL